jgi:hypothetical protein
MDLESVKLLYLATEIYELNNNGIFEKIYIKIDSMKVYCVITAWNPGDNRFTSSQNKKLNESLRADITALGFDPVNVVCKDPNSDYFEDSFLIENMPIDSGKELGKKYSQVAIFVIENGLQKVVSSFENWVISRPIQLR